MAQAAGNDKRTGPRRQTQAGERSTTARRWRCPIFETAKSPMRRTSQTPQAQAHTIAKRPPSSRHIAKTSNRDWPTKDRRNGENDFIGLELTDSSPTAA